MSKTAKGQVTASAAEVYEEFFVPALFAEWAPRMADALRTEPRQRVLDVACGTGVVAHALADRVGANGSVVGLDVNEGMLAVARRKGSGITWVRGVAEAMPFEEAHFDGVACQFGLMFFDDRVASVREMMRVLKPGGHLAVAVWDTLDNTPGYAAMTRLLERLFGDEAANSLYAPYALGHQQHLRTLFEEAGVDKTAITTHEGTARFPSIRAWVYTDVKGWTASDLIDEAGFERLVTEAERDLQRFVGADGQVAFPAPAHIVTATKSR